MTDIYTPLDPKIAEAVDALAVVGHFRWAAWKEQSDAHHFWWIVVMPSAGGAWAVKRKVSNELMVDEKSVVEVFTRAITDVRRDFRDREVLEA